MNWFFGKKGVETLIPFTKGVEKFSWKDDQSLILGVDPPKLCGPETGDNLVSCKNTSGRFFYHPDIDAFIRPTEDNLGLQFLDHEDNVLASYDLAPYSNGNSYIMDMQMTDDGLHLGTANAFVDLDFSIDGLRKSFCFQTPFLAKSAGLVCP